MNSTALPVRSATIAHAPANTGRLRNPVLWRYWWRLIRWPGLAFLILSAVFACTSLDLHIARTLYYDAMRQRWMGAGNWWTNDFIHGYGAWLLRVLVVAAMGLCAWTVGRPALRHWRRPAAYFIVAGILSVGTVGLLKTVTNVHCPWSLHEFGGLYPYLHLFDPRPASMPVGRCFPASHASAGFSLLALYFVFRERGRRAALLGLTAGIAVGLIFGIAQQSRGAHFASHDLWSAFLVWLICLTLYTFGFRATLWPPPETPMPVDGS